MNKNEFIKELTKKLEVLEPKELKKVIKHYSELIDEKLLENSDEKSVIKELGDINLIAKKVLQSYKINPKYSKSTDLFDFKEVVENWIKEMAILLSNTIRSIHKSIKRRNKEISLELIFELIIKFVILIIFLAILTLPFEVINKLANSIFDMSFYPANRILSILWKIFTSLIYFGTGIMLFVIMFKDYINYAKEIDKKDMEDELIIEKQKNDFKVDKELSNKRCQNINFIIKIAYRIFMTLFFLIPLWFIQIGLVAGIVFAIYYTYIGVKIAGLIVILIGLVIATLWMSDIFMQLTFKITKIYFFPVFISLIIICFGGLLFAFNIMAFNYFNVAPKIPNFTYKTKIQEFAIPLLDDITLSGSKSTYEVDDNIDDNVIRVEITYCDSITSIRGLSLNYLENKEKYLLSYIEESNIDITDYKYMYRSLITDLKNGNIYNYEKIKEISVVVFGNAKTIEAISK